MWFEGGLASSAFRPPTNLTTRSPWGRKESDTTERLHFTSPTPRARQGGRSLPHALIRSEPCAASGPSQVRRPASGVQRGLLRKAFQDSCGLRLGGLGSGSRCAGCCVSAARLWEERPEQNRLGEAPRRLPPISRGPGQASSRILLLKTNQLLGRGPQLHGQGLHF